LPLQIFCLVVAFIFGITIGSFLNVVIWRLPRGGSLVKPEWSYCPNCEHRLGTWDLFPVFSFLLLGRRCRYCKQPISWRYPGIELLTGLLFLAAMWCFGPTPAMVGGPASILAASIVHASFFCLFLAALVCVFFIDLEHFVIPDGLNVTTALIGIAGNLVLLFMGAPGQWQRVGNVHIPASLVGGAAYAAIIYGIGLLSYVYFVGIVDKKKSPLAAGWHYIRDNVSDWAWIAVYYAGSVVPPLRRFAEPPEPLEGVSAEEIESDEEAGGMGGGDGKLAFAIGANIYLAHAMQSLFWSIVLGALFGIVILIRERRGRGGRTAIPFGPWMVTGALIAMFFGDTIINWYVQYAFPPPAPPAGSMPLPDSQPLPNSQK